jgi:hypothetical protein
MSCQGLRGIPRDGVVGQKLACISTAGLLFVDSYPGALSVPDCGGSCKQLLDVHDANFAPLPFIFVSLAVSYGLEHRTTCSWEQL